MRKTLLFCVVPLALLIAGCAQSAPASTPPPAEIPTSSPTEPPALAPTDARPADEPSTLQAIAREYPRVDGSTSANPLQRVVACKILGVPWMWGGSIFDDTTRAVVPDESSQNVPPDFAEMIYGMVPSGTHGSYVKLIEGDADFILVARSPSGDELQAADDNGVVLDVTAVALDAFVFLAHVDNPVDELALATIRDIYSGKITAWTEVGGIGEGIHTYQRNPNSGSQELMEKLVMRGTPMIESPEMILETMMGPINVIGGHLRNPEDVGDVLGIGYSVYYYAAFIYPHERIKLIGIDGVRPTSDDIASRAYPLTTEVYAVIREGMPEDSTAVLLRDWLLTEQGQAAIQESGYVPLR